MNHTFLPQATLAAACVLLLGGCASVEREPTSARAAQAVAESLHEARPTLRLQADEAAAQTAAQEAAALLREPLSADSAVRVALLAHRGLQASLSALAVSDAERLQAASLPNPHLSLARLRQGSERETEASLSFNLAAWLLRPWVTQLEDQRLAAQQQQTTLEVLAHIAEVRQAFYSAVAAEQTLAALTQVQQSAAAGAELAQRLQAAGNFSRLQQAREQGFAAQAKLNLVRAKLAALSSRERLARAIGQAAQPELMRLPERLPELPAQLEPLPDVQRQALAQRLDVQAARQQTQRSAERLGAGRLLGFVNVLEVGYIRNVSNAAPPQTGWELSFELPLFDWGGARQAKAQALYSQQLHLAALVAQEASSQVREAEATRRGAWAVARQYQEEVVPLAQRVSDENLLRYNGMLIGVLELLADARSNAATVAEAIAAQRDFWLAQVALEQALRGPVSVPALAAPGSARAADASAH